MKTAIKTLFILLSVIPLSQCELEQESLIDNSRIESFVPSIFLLNTIDVVRETILWGDADTSLRKPEFAYYLKTGASSVVTELVGNDTLERTVQTTFVNCLGDDGRLRNGDLNVVSSGGWRDTNAYFLFTMHMDVDGSEVRLAGRIDYNGSNTDSINTWSLSQTVFGLTLDNGDVYDLRPEMNLALTQGSELQWLDSSGVGKDNQVYEFVGVSTSRSSGGSEGVISTDSALVISAACPYPTAGSMRIIETNKTIAFLDLTKSCSSVQTWTIGSYSGEIILK